MGEGNAAVQAVGRTFFRVTMVGYLLAAAAMFPAVIVGIQRHYFEYEMDRCSCVPAGEECAVGLDFVRVAIGWQKFTFDEIQHKNGCPIAVERFETDPVELRTHLDDEQSFGAFDKVYPISGEFQKTHNPTQADESNGGSAAGGGVVAMQVVAAFFSIFTYKMLKASYLSNGSHCSVGLGLMTRLNCLVGLGLAASIVSYWWLVEGRFGDANKALTQALLDVSIQ